MAKLDTGRMLNSTRLKKVDDAHRQLEADLEDIFGIPDNDPIDNPIFGTNVEDPSEPPVQPDGSIRGVPTFATSAPQTGASNAPGVQFGDGTYLLKICLEQGKLQLFKSDDDGATWDVVSNLEDPASGQGLFTALSDVDIDTLVADKIVKVQSDGGGGYEFVLADPATVAGRTTFVSLDDTPIDALSSHVNEIVYVASSSALGYTAFPTGLGEPWLVFLKAQTTENWGSSGLWKQTYNWIHDPDIGSAGGQVITSGVLINQTADEVRANAYLSLEVGTYDISFWYYTADSNDKYGVRMWKVQPASGTGESGSPGTCIGPAADGIEHMPTLSWEYSTRDPVSINGNKYMGSAKLIVTSAGNFEFDIRQTNGIVIYNCDFYISLAKVK